MSAVRQRGLDILRQEEAERDALRALLEERLKGSSETNAEARAATEAMIVRKRTELGLRD